MKNLTVNASKKYDILISDSLSDFPKNLYAGKKVCVVSDDKVAEHYLEEAAALRATFRALRLRRTCVE